VLLATVLVMERCVLRARRLLAEISSRSLLTTARMDSLHRHYLIVEREQFAHERAIRALQRFFDCGGGAIYVCRPDGVLAMRAGGLEPIAKVTALPPAVVDNSNPIMNVGIKPE